MSLPVHLKSDLKIPLSHFPTLLDFYLFICLFFSAIHHCIFGGEFFSHFSYYFINLPVENEKIVSLKE